MIKRTSFLYTLLLLAVVLGAASCSSDSSQGSIPVRPAGPANSVRVYTHRYLFHDDQIFKAFEQRANAKVEVIQLSYGQLLAEARSNGLANADLVILNDLAQLKQLEGMGLLQPFQAGIFEKQFPSRFLDPETYWAPLTRWTMGYVYRKDRLSAAQMNRYQDIAMPELQGRVAISHIDSSGLISLAGAIKAARSEEVARLWLQGLTANLAYPPAGNDYQNIQMVAAGKADVALVSGSAYYRFKYSGSPAAMKASELLEYQMPNDADGSNYYTLSAVGLLKNAPHRDFAIALIEWLCLPENQQNWAEGAFEYPLNSFAQASDFLLDIERLPEGNLSPFQYDNQLNETRKMVGEYIR